MWSLSNPHPVVGNGQHIGCAALVLAATLLSIQFHDIPEPSRPLDAPPPNASKIEGDAGSKEQVQCDYPKLKIMDDRVVFQVGGFFRRLHVPREVPTLREAAQKLSGLVAAYDAITSELLGLSRPANAMLSVTSVHLVSHKSLCHAIDVLYIYIYRYTYVYLLAAFAKNIQ